MKMGGSSNGDVSNNTSSSDEDICYSTYKKLQPYRNFFKTFIDGASQSPETETALGKLPLKHSGKDVEAFL